MKRLLIVMVVMGLAIVVPSGAFAWAINFENGVDGNPVNIPGISFHSLDGFDSIYGDSRTSLYNTFSDDLGMGWNDWAPQYHHNGAFWMWVGPEATAEGVKADFVNKDGTFFSAGYGSCSDFYLEAHLTDASVVSVFGGCNLSAPMRTLTVSARAGTFIDYVVLHGEVNSGNTWLVDDLSGDATGINPVPEPASVALLGLGIAVLGLARSRRRR